MPSPPSTNLVGQWKADSLSLSDGQAVSSWADSSGSGNTASQSTGNNQPIYKANILNGLPVVRFNPTSFQQFLNVSTLAANPSAVSLFAVVSFVNFTNPRTMLGASGNQGLEWQGSTSSTSRLAEQNTLAIGSGSTTLSTGTFYLLEVTYSTPNYAFYLKSATDGSGSAAGAFLSTTTVIGQGTGASSHAMYGDIAEILYYNAVLSTGNRQLAEQYLIGKWFPSLTTASISATSALTASPTVPYASPAGLTMAPAGSSAGIWSLCGPPLTPAPLVSM